MVVEFNSTVIFWSDNMVENESVTVAIGAIVGIMIVSTVANYLGAGLEATLVTGAVTAIAALASPSAGKTKEE
jgi:putative Ca2+/H+ antiporter (TMEM165/GDT1 family)